MGKQLGFYINQKVCSGCSTCQVACKDKNDLKVGQRWRRVTEVSGGSYSFQGTTLHANVSAYFISIGCNHCVNPKCVKNCPTGALYKREEDGLVLHDQDKCIGCRYCTWSCPYGAPQYNPDLGKVGKCNACVDLLKEGEKPACVAACPLRAIDFGEIGELRKKYGAIQTIKGLPEADITNPSLVIQPHRHAVK